MLRTSNLFRTHGILTLTVLALLGPIGSIGAAASANSSVIGDALRVKVQRLQREGGELSPAGQLEWAARAYYGEQFAGVSIADDGTSTISVARTQLDEPQPLPEDLQLIEPDAAVSGVQFSESELERVFDQVVADEDILLDEYGVVLTHVGVDEEANSVVVNVDELTSATNAMLRQRYGNAVLVGQLPGPVGTLASRVNDTAPAKGGAIVYSELDAYEAPCSTGFIWTTGSTDRDNVISATHCTGPGLFWRNNGSYYGTTVEASAETGNTDWALIDLNRGTSAKVYNTSTGRARVVTSFFTDFGSGLSLCQSGSTTGNERCGYNVTATDECVQLSYPPPGSFSQLTCGLNFAFKSGSAPAILGGDSGGPVYRRNGDGTATAAGIIVGISTPNPSVFFYTPIAVIQDSLDGGPFTCYDDPDTTCPGGE